METPPLLSMKFLMVGDTSVGKTTLVHMFSQKVFEPNTESTVGVEFNSFPIEVDGKPVSLQIWDTAGQELYRSLAKSYYRDAIGVFLVFSFDAHDSFANLNQWIADIKQLCNPKAIIFLVGNKNDLINERQVTQTEVEKFAETNSLEYFETSAKNNYNVREMVYHAAAVVYKAVISGEIDVAKPSSRHKIDVPEVEDKKCC